MRSRRGGTGRCRTMRKGGRWWRLAESRGNRASQHRPSSLPARAAAAQPTDASPALQRPPVRDKINSFQEGCRSCRKSSRRQSPQTAGPARFTSIRCPLPRCSPTLAMRIRIRPVHRTHILLNPNIVVPATPRAPRRPHPRASLHPHRECTTLETSRCARPSYPPLARRLSRRQALPTGCLSRQGGSRGTGVGLGPCPPRRPAASLVPTTGSRARPSASTHACSRRYDDGDIPEEQARVKVRRLSRPAAVNSTPQRIYPQ